MTWLPLLALGLVVLGAIPVYLLSSPITYDCRTFDGGQTCKVWFQTAQIYWWTALVLAYVVIAAGYRRVARARGVDSRVLPYVIAGVGFVLAGAAFAGIWVAVDAPAEPSAFGQFVFRLVDSTSAIGLALLVLAWLERHVELMAFSFVYLLIVLVPVNFGWEMNGEWQFVPPLVISGSLLLLGSIGFAVKGKR